MVLCEETCKMQLILIRRNITKKFFIEILEGVCMDMWEEKQFHTVLFWTDASLSKMNGTVYKWNSS
jgi:hypothetical protein